MLRKRGKKPGEDQEPLVGNGDSQRKTTNNALDVRTRSWAGNFVVALRYVWAETTKNKRNFFVGCTAVFLVVMSIGLLQNTVDNSGVLFMKLAEDTVGEMDLILTPKKTNADSFLVNSTEVDRLLADEPSVLGTSPRWIFLSRIINIAEPDKNASTIMLIIDSKKEQNISLGRAWPHAPLEGRSLHVSEPLLRQIGVKANKDQLVSLRVDFLALMQTITGIKTSDQDLLRDFIASLMGQAANSTLENMPPFLQNLPILDPTIVRTVFAYFGIDVDAVLKGVPVDLEPFREYMTFSTNMTVIDSIDESIGKFPKALGNVVVIESALVEQLINDFIADVWARIPRTDDEIAKFFGPNAEEVKLALTILRFTYPDFFKQPIFDPKSPAPKLNINYYAFTVVVMYRDRFTVYLKDKNEIDAAAIVFSNKVAARLGRDYPAGIDAPLVQALGLVYYLRLLLNQILSVVQIFLIGLGAFLIYALLISDVESKVYESGMLRALGMEQYTLIMLLAIQSVLFSIPGICVGLLLCFLAFMPVGLKLSAFVAVEVPLSLTPLAIGISVSVGLVMPLAALIGPVQRALSKTLRDALDLYHNVASDSRVIITKLESLGLSAVQTNAALLMIVCGFVVYYMIPLAFIFLNLALFFNIFVGILLGMLFGLSLLAMLVHPVVQRLVVELIMWGPDRRSLKDLVRKNLQGHTRRNAKTAILFTTCIAFIIFSGSVFTLQSNNLIDNVRVGIGADIIVTSFASNPDLALDEDRMRRFLNESMLANKDHPVVLDYSFATFSLNDLQFIAYTRIANLAEDPSNLCFIYGVERNYLSSTYDKYFVIQEYDSSLSYETSPAGVRDVIQSLYTDPKSPHQFQSSSSYYPPNINTGRVRNGQFNYQSITTRSNQETYNETVAVINSEALRLSLSISVNTPVQLVVAVIDSKRSRFYDSTRLYYLADSRAMVSKAPGYLFSSYSQTAARTPLLVSMDTYSQLMHKAHSVSYKKDETLPDRPPKRALYVRIASDATFEQRDAVANGLRNFIKNDQILVTDTEQLVSATDTAINILNLFFNIVALIVMVLCFFVLLVSFTANVTENAWEFGVLRSLGLNSSQVIRVYIYEAMVVIIASVFLGFSIGSLVAITLTLQADLFSELAFHMVFPTLLFCSIVGMSVVVALLGSYIPANQLRKKPIAQALKNSS